MSFTPPTRPAEPQPAGGTPSSAEAAAGASRFAPRLEDRILELFDAVGAAGLTNGEIAAALDLRDVTAWPRVTRLREKGKIRASGRKRPSPKSGRPMTVWVRTTEVEERDILERRRQEDQALNTPPGPHARKAAAQILDEWDLGSLFRSEEHLARVIQAAINQTHKRELARARRERTRKGDADA